MHVAPQRGDGIVLTQEDHVRHVIDVEEVDITVGIEERNGIGARCGQAVLRHRQIRPLGRTGARLGEERELIVVRAIGQHALGGVARGVRLTDHRRAIDLALE